MPDTPIKEPATLAAGNTWTFQRTFPDYPASTWTITYYLRGPSQPADIVATASGDDHLVTVPAATTTNWNEGRYAWQAYAVSGAERYLADAGYLDVTKNFSDDDAVYEARSHARICLAKIEAVLEDSTAENVQSYVIGNRQLVRIDPEKLMAMRDYYRAEVRAEDAREAAAAGGGKSKKIKVRFPR